MAYDDGFFVLFDCIIISVLVSACSTVENSFP